METLLQEVQIADSAIVPIPTLCDPVVVWDMDPVPIDTFD
jgi:hypothetical protein